MEEGWILQLTHAQPCLLGPHSDTPGLPGLLLSRSLFPAMVQDLRLPLLCLLPNPLLCTALSCFPYFLNPSIESTVPLYRQERLRPGEGMGSV